MTYVFFGIALPMLAGWAVRRFYRVRWVWLSALLVWAIGSLTTTLFSNEVVATQGGGAIPVFGILTYPLAFMVSGAFASLIWRLAGRVLGRRVQAMYAMAVGLVIFFISPQIFGALIALGIMVFGICCMFVGPARCFRRLLGLFGLGGGRRGRRRP